MNSRLVLNLALLIVVLTVFSCSSSSRGKTATYLHIAHTRLYQKGNTIDPVAEKIDFKSFDMVWIGGDLMGHSTQDTATITYLDHLFDLSDENVLWAPGNHDYDYHPEWIEPITLRPKYYTTHKNGITILVLDTQDSLSHISGSQLEMVRRVTDTIATSSHLVLLTHKLIWFDGNPVLRPKVDSITNGGLCESCVYGINPNNYYRDVYPELNKVKNRGIDILNIAGDIGAKVKSFEYTDELGIHFLASGLKSGEPGNKVLLFEHNIKKQTLNWKFVLLEELPGLKGKVSAD